MEHTEKPGPLFFQRGNWFLLIDSFIQGLGPFQECTCLLFVQTNFV